MISPETARPVGVRLCRDTERADACHVTSDQALCWGRHIKSRRYKARSHGVRSPPFVSELPPVNPIKKVQRARHGIQLLVRPFVFVSLLAFELAQLGLSCETKFH